MKKLFFVLFCLWQQCFCSSGPWVYFYLSLSFSRFVLSGPWAIRNSGPDGKLLLEQVREGQSSLELHQNERKTGKTGERNKNRGKEGEGWGKITRYRVPLRGTVPLLSVCVCVWSGNWEDQQKFCAVSDISLRWCLNSWFLFLACCNYLSIYSIFFSDCYKESIYGCFDVVIRA